MHPQCKKRRMYSRDAQDFFPILLSSEYFMEPSVVELAAREQIDPGFCSRVPNFVIGRVGYGCIKFLGDTDVRWLNFDKIVKLDRHVVSVYENENDKPPIGQGLNKIAEVTLILHLSLAYSHDLESTKIISKLRKCTDRQGAKFLSFDQSSGEWKFLVHHFSRFGLVEDEEEDDVIMDDLLAQPTEENHEAPYGEIVLSHSLPAHLGLDPIRMQELKMVMFQEEEDDELIDCSFPSDKRIFSRELVREKSASSSARGSLYRSFEGSAQKAGNRISSSPLKKSPVPLLEYNKSSSDISPSMGILMTGQNKEPLLKVKKVEGFRLDENQTTPLSGNFSSNVVDAALFMGRSFRVGWGPNGILVHTGTPVGKTGTGLSSIIHVEKIAIDGTARDEQNKVKEELVDFCFSFPLNVHKSLDHETVEVKVDSSILKLRKIVSSRFMLPDICRDYIDVIEKQIEVAGLSESTRDLLNHQVAVWELIKVLFSERETNELIRVSSDDVGEDMVLDKFKDRSSNIDAEAKPFLRRAEFSYWLRDSVWHRVQKDVSCLNDSKYLENILVFLTGRQLDAAVQLAASKGDVRLAILLSQTGGSMVNRADMAQQLDIWKDNGMDFSYIEKERLKLYELLAGNIQGSLQDWSVDWKRHLGLVAWYQLPPDTHLPVIISTYEQLLSEGRAPHPVPVYIDECPLTGVEWSVGDHYDIAYYLMLLHANGEKAFGLLKSMFSAFSSTFDPFDYHMIWHQRAILESIGAFSSKDLNVLDISFVSQLLCMGLCHWAIYVAIHMPYYAEFPYIQANLIKEILLQYCETWSASEAQQKFIVDLGVPSTWMHEALAIYHEYYRNLPVALEHYLKCSKLEKAHSIFMTTVAHSLYLSSKDSEIWRIASIMEEHKLEIADWDLGAGIFINFYGLRSSLQEDITQSEPDLLARKNEECRYFFSRLNQSLRVWGSRLPVDARASYARMAKELCDLLQTIPGEGSAPSVQMSCFETMLDGPIPQDLRAAHLQEALSVFSFLLARTSSY